nr:immunoglobulin light chain junction region [Macaca mulatta]MPO03325.1 immunoglobulin light chain junction region [Macaca mulatta]MPO03397.1 immunoglobulin light chain junction region [Macaca mulatta]MPO03423.1 immunoglobulin light chain junction region [Macaca mulatta]MPO03484.1 immunoglobulin light chain junction region [Macaca mulatta]
CAAWDHILSGYIF